MRLKLFREEIPEPPAKTPPATVEELLVRVGKLERGYRRMARGYLLLFVVAAFSSYLAFHTLHKLTGDEKHTRIDAAHTRLIQREGEPVAICLLQGIRAVEPFLLRAPKAAAPLESYSILQGNRYTSVDCPTPAEARLIIAKRGGEKHIVAKH